MKLRAGSVRLRAGNVRLAAGSGGSVAPSPIPVTNLALASATSTSLLLTFTSPPSGSVVWNIRAHGASAWLAATGSFGASTATINGFGSNTPLASSTAYDVQALATNNGQTVATELDNISTTAASVYVPPTVPAGTATRYDVILSQSTVAPGGSVPGNLYPNANWPSGTGNTVTLKNAGPAMIMSNGAPWVPASGSGASITIALPNGGNAAVPFSFPAATAGEYSLTPSNNAGLYDPYPAPFTCFAPSSGTSRTFTVSPAREDNGGFQYDNLLPNPTGFGVGKGSGEYWFNLAGLSGATDGLWARLYDSANGTTTKGSGTPLHSSPVQVHGPLSNGLVRILLPATLTPVYIDVATSADFANPVRIPAKFVVCFCLQLGSRSQETGLARGFPYGVGEPTGSTYVKTAVYTSSDARYGRSVGDTTPPWYVHDNSGTAMPNAEGASSGAMEFGRLIEQELGVLTRIAGTADSGHGFDNFVNADGTPAGGTVATADAALGGKYRVTWMNVSGIDNGTETYADDAARTAGFSAWLSRNRPANAIIGWCHGASGWFGSDGSSPLGHARVQNAAKLLELADPTIVSKENTTWTEFSIANPGHASMASRKLYAQSGLRLLLSAEIAAMGGYQTSDRGPELAPTGRIVGRTVRIAFKLHGGTALVPVGITESNPNYTINTATPAEIACGFSLWPGANGKAGDPMAICIDTATVDTSSPPSGYDGEVVLALTGSSGVTYTDGTNLTTSPTVPSAITLNYLADFSLSKTGLPLYQRSGARSAVLCDNRNTMGLGYGWPMRPALDRQVS